VAALSLCVTLLLLLPNAPKDPVRLQLPGSPKGPLDRSTCPGRFQMRILPATRRWSEPARPARPRHDKVVLETTDHAERPSLPSEKPWGAGGVLLKARRFEKILETHSRGIHIIIEDMAKCKVFV